LRFSALSILLILFAAPRLQASEFIQPREEDLRILEMRLDNEILSQEITAYQHTAGIVLPLGALARILDLSITVTPERGSAQGFIAQSDRTFFLDVNRGEVTLRGKVDHFDAALVELQQDDIYVDSTLLSRWLPVDFDIDLFALRISVHPREPLPMQLRRSRETRIAQFNRKPTDRGFPLWTNPYALLAMPLIDQTFRLGYHSGKIDASYTTYATADLGEMESAWYVHGDRGEQIQDVRLTLGRKDPDARLLGWLHAREYSVGSVSQPGSSLVSTPKAQAIGFVLSSYPLRQASQFASNDFDGDLPPGWDVELYHNHVLLNYQSAREDGRYAFENVPLLFGFNFFQLVFYGPEGQQRVENHEFVIGASLTPPGAAYYRVVATRERGFIDNPDVAGSTRGYRVLARTDIGVLKRLSVTAEAETIPLTDGQHNYAKAGLRAYLKSFFAYADVVRDQRGGWAREVGFQTRVLGIGMSGSHADLTSGYVSELFPVVTDPISRHDVLRFDGTIPAWILPRLNVTFETDRNEFLSGRKHVSIRNRVSGYYRGFAAASELRWGRDGALAPVFDGTFQLSRLVRGHSLRGEVSYQFATQPRVTHVNLSADGFLTPHYRYGVSLSQSLLADDASITLGINKLFGFFAAGLQVVYNNRGTVGINFDLSVGVGINPRNSHPTFSSQPIAGSGAASLRPFLDSNLNGIYDSGEETIPEVAFMINGEQSKVVTPKDGVAFLTRLPVYRPIDLGLDVGTLENPSWAPELKGIRFTPRPGKTVEIDFPVALTGEVDGTLHIEHLGKRTQAGGVGLQLVDRSSRVYQETKTAYDGYYTFPAVLPGDYTLRVSPAEVARLVLTEPPRRLVKITGDVVLDGIDLVIHASEADSGSATAGPFASSVAPASRMP
jgi:hypothetical protein